MDRNLTTEQIKTMLIAKVKAEQAKLEELLSRIHKAINKHESVLEKDESTREISNFLYNWQCELIAVRLKNNDRTIPLLTHDDYRDFQVALTSKVFELIGNFKELDLESQKQIDNQMKEMFDFALSFNNDSLKNIRKSYAEEWKWIDYIVSKSEEKDMEPEDLMQISRVRDEIIRVSTTKKEFVSSYKKFLAEYDDIDKLVDKAIEPTLSLMPNISDEELSEGRQIFKEMFLSNLKTVTKATKAWINEEIARIYPKNNKNQTTT